MELKPQTLAVSIQCIVAVIKALDKRLQDDATENGAELEQLLVTFDLAQSDLQAAYQIALAQYGGLPAYEELVEWSL
jgi:hypothetical protein